MSNKGTSIDLVPATEADEEKARAFDLEPHRVKMIFDEPFFAAVLRGVNYERTDAIPTAGVLAKDGDVHMWWNPKFLSSLTTLQVKGLLKHEAMHLALDHTTTRRLEPHIIHNYATDLAINSDIPEKELPDGGLIPGKAFKELTDEDRIKMGPETALRYKRVSDKIASLPKGLSSEEYFSRLMKDSQIAKDIQNQGDGDSALPGGMDNHDGWEELSDEERELVKGKIAKAVSDAVKEADSTGRWGSVGAGTRKMLRERISKEVDWRAILRKFCGMSRRGTRTTTWSRINTVHIHPKWGPLSTAAKRGYTSSIAVYIDQSGSVSDQDLELSFGELCNLKRRTEFTTFNFDTKVDEESETAWKRGSTPCLRTRFGGTDFECVTKHANKNSHRFDGYIIITDGEAAKPSSSRLKRGWMLIPGTKLFFDADGRDFVMKMKNPVKKAA